jgi:hypothetical protein
MGYRPVICSPGFQIAFVEPIPYTGFWIICRDSGLGDHRAEYRGLLYNSPMHDLANLNAGTTVAR